ncbi:protein FAM216A isoform X2 [Ranitomeya variabilis]
MKNEAYLKHTDLTLGQKRYLCSIAKIYSTSNMRALTEKHLRSQIRCDPLLSVTRLFWTASALSTLDPSSPASLPATLPVYASTPGTSFYSNTRYLPVSSAASTNPAGLSVPLGQPPRVRGLTEGSTRVLRAYHSVPVRGDLLRVSGAHAVTPPSEPPGPWSSGSTFNFNKYECELLHLCLRFHSLQKSSNRLDRHLSEMV